jgi:hypothetical protein
MATGGFAPTGQPLKLFAHTAPSVAMRIERLSKPLRGAPVLNTRDLAPLYRLWEPYNTGSHLYTTDPSEGNAAISHDGYFYMEVEAYVLPRDSSVQADDTAPVFRLYQPTSKDYIYTTRQPEQLSLVAEYGYVNQGFSFLAFTKDKPGAIPIYRRRSVKSGAHMFNRDPSFATADPTDKLADEGIAFYAFSPAEGAFISDLAAARIGPQVDDEQLNSLYGYPPDSNANIVRRVSRQTRGIGATDLGVDETVPETDGIDGVPVVGALVPGESNEDVSGRTVHQTSPPPPPLQLIPDNASSYSNPNGPYGLSRQWVDYLLKDTINFVTDSELALLPESFPLVEFREKAVSWPKKSRKSQRRLDWKSSSVESAYT